MDCMDLGGCHRQPIIVPLKNKRQTDRSKESIRYSRYGKDSEKMSQGRQGTISHSSLNDGSCSKSAKRYN